MREKDIKTLWGRSGNRCTICKMELTPEGDIPTIGEMAHIVASSDVGPRGDSGFETSERDSYSNLILLCPTDHVRIDNTPDEWTVDRLHQVKILHEQWVSQQLDRGSISVREIDNTAFLSSRIEGWKEFVKGRIWVVVSITPLNISGDLINPIERRFIEQINTIKLPHQISRNPIVNSYNTRPSEYGLLNDELQDLSKGNGHRVQIFRNGHCEFMVCLHGSVDELTSDVNTNNPQMRGSRIVRYTDFAESILLQIEALLTIWRECLPFRDMALSSHLLNTKDARLYSHFIPGQGDLYGDPIESNILEIKDIVNKGISLAYAGEYFLKRYANSFGLMLNNVRNDKGELVRPGRLKVRF